MKFQNRHILSIILFAGVVTTGLLMRSARADTVLFFYAAGVITGILAGLLHAVSPSGQAIIAKLKQNTCDNDK